MKLFAIIFAAVLLAGLSLWGIISHKNEEARRQAEVEAAVRRSIVAVDNLVILAQTQRPDNLTSALQSVEYLRASAKIDYLPEVVRRHALEAADDYERALARWR